MDYFKKKGRQSTAKLLLTGAGFMLAGNILCAIMTISTAPFIQHDFMKVLAVILAFAIFYSIMFSVGYKDGDREQHYVRLHKAQPPSQYKWLKLGAVLTVIMMLPSVLLLINKLSGMYFDMLMVYRVLDGMVYALSLMLIPENTVDAMNIYVPIVFMLCYALIPVATHFGYYFGYTGKLENENIMYK